MVIRWISGKNAKGKLRKVRYINMEENLEKWASECCVVIGEIIWPCSTLWSIVCDLLSQWRWGPNRTHCDGGSEKEQTGDRLMERCE